MSNFNLEKALQGEPVCLRNGMKGIIYYRVPENYTFRDGSPVYRPLKGMIFTEEGHLSSSGFEWLLDGKVDDHYLNNLDIIGMWTDGISNIIQKAYKENLPLKTRDGTKVFISTIVEKTDKLTKNFPVFGYNNESNSYRWSLNGRYLNNTEDDLDIVGLWKK